jgi:hypothetical protein
MMLIFHKLFLLFYIYVFHMLSANDATVVRVVFLLSLVSICFHDVVARGQWVL